MSTLKPYPSDVNDAEWALVAPYLCLIREDAPQRAPPPREVFNGLRYVVRTGSPWRYMPRGCYTLSDEGTFRMAPRPPIWAESMHRLGMKPRRQRTIGQNSSES